MASSFAQRKKDEEKATDQPAPPEGGGGDPETEAPELSLKSALWQRFIAILNSLALQTMLYLTFIAVFQMLAGTVRIKEEYYMDKHVMDRFIENHFDSSHNTFESVRRIADIYEWGNQVLWPGFFADMGPCNPVVGARRADGFVKGCDDDAWPDGDGPFHMDGASPLGIDELVRRMDQLDWTEGVMIRQSRSAPQLCHGVHQLGMCYPEISYGGLRGSTLTYGYNKTHPGDEPEIRFPHYTTEELGGNPGGIKSAAIASMKTYEVEGYAAVVIPFFSEVYLPEQHDLVEYVRDYRETYVNTTNGKTPLYYCVRVSPNSRDIHQVCDPTDTGDGKGRMTGVVRQAVEEMWNDLKRGHFLDSMSRTLTITLQLKSNHIGVRYRITLMFELTSLGAILPSYDVETRVMDQRQLDDMMLYAHLSFVMVLLFAFLECVEIANLGPVDYAQNLWHVMDWTNFIIFFMVYAQVLEVSDALQNYDCSSYMCSLVGYFDDWRLMDSYRRTKQFLSLCVCIQLFKVTKFTSALIPKMSLMSNVLRIAAVDLLFFGIVFFNSLIAFSCMLYVQLGPVMEEFYDQLAAIISLFRALFGDFDIDEIMNNSSGYLNAILFLAYLFVAIFIMLSLFLAILAEAQAAVRDREAQMKLQQPEYNEYGVMADAYHGASRAAQWVLVWLGCRKPPPDDTDSEGSSPRTGGAEAAEGTEVAETRTQTVDEVVGQLRTEVSEIGQMVRDLAGEMATLRGGEGSGGAADEADTRLAEVRKPPLAGMGVEEARMMRKVVEMLDSKLSTKLQTIDERLARRDKSDKERMRQLKERGLDSGQKSRPPPVVVKASDGADSVGRPSLSRSTLSMTDPALSGAVDIFPLPPPNTRAASQASREGRSTPSRSADPIADRIHDMSC